MKQKLPINSAGRLALWVYPRIAASRFAGAPVIVEMTRSYEMPDFDQLPNDAEVGLELWGGAVNLRLDGELRRVYTGQFEFITHADEEQARAAFLNLWKRIELLESIVEVQKAIAAWHALNRRDNY